MMGGSRSLGWFGPTPGFGWSWIVERRDGRGSVRGHAWRKSKAERRYHAAMSAEWPEYEGTGWDARG